MKIAGFFMFSILCLAVTAYAQDTLHPEPVSYYSSADEPNRSMEFASRVRYAREDIVFSEKHKKIEYCYYYDNERICYGDVYRIEGDSVLLVGDTAYGRKIERWTWRLNKEGDYTVSRYYEGVYESGLAGELMPLKQIAASYTTTADKKDTLWIKDFTAINEKMKMTYPRYIFPKAKIEGKIYGPGEVDSPPLMSNGEPPKQVALQNTHLVFNSYYLLRSMSFIVTKEGAIKNIEQFEGNFPMDSGPEYIMEIMQKIIQMGPLKPALKKGVPVNCRWYVDIDMMDKTLNELKMHPALEKKRK